MENKTIHKAFCGRNARRQRQAGGKSLEHAELLLKKGFVTVLPITDDCNAHTSEPDPGALVRGSRVRPCLHRPRRRTYIIVWHLAAAKTGSAPGLDFGRLARRRCRGGRRCIHTSLRKPSLAFDETFVFASSSFSDLLVVLRGRTNGGCREARAGRVFLKCLRGPLFYFFAVTQWVQFLYNRLDDINYFVVGGVTFAPAWVRRGFSFRSESQGNLPHAFAARQRAGGERHNSHFKTAVR